MKTIRWAKRENSKEENEKDNERDDGGNGIDVSENPVITNKRD